MKIRDTYNHSESITNIQNYYVFLIPGLLMMGIGKLFGDYGLIFYLIGLPFVLIGGGRLLGFLFRKAISPFVWLYRMMTATTDYSMNVSFHPNTMRRRVKYNDVFQLIAFGIVGKVLFWIIFLALMWALFTYRPFEGGYAIGQSSYEEGCKVVYTLNGRHSGTVVGMEDKKYLIETDGEVNAVKPTKVLGAYEEFEKDSSAFFHSISGGIKRFEGYGLNFKKDFIERVSAILPQ